MFAIVAAAFVARLIARHAAGHQRDAELDQCLIANVLPESKMRLYPTKVINITQATDLVARHFLTAATVDTTTPKLGAYTATQVNTANQAIAKLLLGLDNQSIVELLPESTVKPDGNSSGTSSDYALLLYSLDAYLQQSVTTERTNVDTARADVVTKQADYATAKNASDLAAQDAAAKALDAAAKAAVAKAKPSDATAQADAAAAARRESCWPDSSDRPSYRSPGPRRPFAHGAVCRRTPPRGRTAGR